MKHNRRLRRSGPLLIHKAPKGTTSKGIALPRLQHKPEVLPRESLSRESLSRESLPQSLLDLEKRMNAALRIPADLLAAKDGR